MKNITLSKKLLVIAIALSLLVSTGLTLAYFSDYTKTEGKASLALTGKTEIEEKFEGNNKLITIHNTGDIDMVVRVQVFGPDGMTISGDKWEENKENGFWYYEDAIPPKGASSVLEAVVGDVPVDPDNDLEIIVVHESAPAVYYKVTGELIPQNEWFD